VEAACTTRAVADPFEATRAALASRRRCLIASLPRVLAGPIVRRVELRSCSFWIALSREATVKALIWKGERNTTPASADTPFGTGELAPKRQNTPRMYGPE
jgi:hypothetical protein